MSSRIESLIQKCIYWSHQAIQTDQPGNYSITPAWKKALGYAKEAHQLYQKLPVDKQSSLVLNQVGKNILKRGYPVISHQSLLNDDDGDENSDNNDNEEKRVNDPIDSLEQSLLDTQQQINTLQTTVTEQEKLLKQLEQQKQNYMSQCQEQIQTLRNTVKDLQFQKEVLEDDLNVARKLHQNYKSRVVGKLDEYDSLQAKVADLQHTLLEQKQIIKEYADKQHCYEEFARKIVALMNENQREALSQILEETMK